MNREYFDIISRECELLGMSCHYETRKKHDRIYIDTGEEEIFLVVPQSPSDSRRGAKKCLADFRRVVGQRSGVAKSPRRGARRDRCKPRGPDLKPVGWAQDVSSTKEDPFEVLARHPLARSN
jgi:hypothetical protein